MLDIKFVRENPDVVKQNIKNKFQESKLELVDEVIELDQKNRDIKNELQSLQANRNKLSKQIGALMGQGKKEEAEEVKKQVTAQADRMAELSADEKEVEEKMSISGIDKQSKNIDLLDENNKDLKPLLNSNEIVVSKNLKEKYELKENDTLTVEINNKEYTYNIKGFNNDYFNYTFYQEREELSKTLGFNKSVYNIIYSKDKNYSNLAKMEDSLSFVSL